jgi:hypothetical protein
MTDARGGSVIHAPIVASVLFAPNEKPRLGCGSRGLAWGIVHTSRGNQPRRYHPVSNYRRMTDRLRMSPRPINPALPPTPALVRDPQCRHRRSTPYEMAPAPQVGQSTGATREHCRCALRLSGESIIGGNCDRRSPHSLDVPVDPSARVIIALASQSGVPYRLRVRAA